MAKLNVKLDHGGVASLLKSGPMQAMVQGVAEEIANNVRSQGITVASGTPLPVTVTTYTTDRAAASVAIAHAAGVAVQAKHGALSKAASAAGVSVAG